jgi:CPA2 family monovalent cation:H+ antiporter-2
MQNLIPILIAAVGIATLLNVVLKKINMPTVIGYIFTGAIVGSIFDVHVHGNETLEHIAEFGVVFLMFSIGLEFSVSHLKSMKKEVFLFGLLQVGVSAAVLATIAHLIFDIELKAAIIVGFGLALSSTAIVLKILNETGKIKTEVGRNSLGILIFQDIAVIPILLLITIFTDTGRSLSDLLLSTSMNAVIALGILIAIGKLALGHVFKAVAGTNSKEIYMGSILLTVVGASYIAHHFGFSYSLGGFIAGMMIADTIYKYQVEADLIPFRDLLLGVFFVSVGLQIDFKIVAANIVPIVGLGLGIVIIKAFVIFCLLLFGNSKKVALKSAITLCQIGEFSLVVFSLVMANRMMDPTLVQILMVIVIASMVIAPFLINNVEHLSRLLIKSKIEEEALDQSSMLGGHVILCGFGAFGRVVSDQLEESGINHVVLTNNTESFVKAKEIHKAVVFGNPDDRDMLERLKIRDAMSVILALDDFEDVKKTSASITLIDPKIKIIAKIPSEEERHELADFNHELLIDGNQHTATLLVDQINRSRLLTRETATLKYLDDYSLDNPSGTIQKVEREQTRLLDVISRSFNGLREEKDIMHIKAFHDSFKVLSEIIGGVITELMSGSSLSPKEYERINILLDNQHQLISMNDTLEQLGHELKALKKNEKTKALSEMAVEGLDAILLTLKDIADNYDEDDMLMLEGITSNEKGGLFRIRESYLGAEKELDASGKSLLLSSTNHMDRLRSLFGQLGSNYRRLFEGN